jgi:hypothetical protein
MPAYGNFVLDKGYDAAAALAKNRAVKFSAEETVTPVTAITDNVVGIALFAVTAPEIAKGKGATIREAGIAEVECSAAIALGSMVTIAADGRGKAAATGERIIGQCVKGTANAGEYAAVRLSLPGPLAVTGAI